MISTLDGSRYENAANVKIEEGTFDVTAVVQTPFEATRELVLKSSMDSSTFTLVNTINNETFADLTISNTVAEMATDSLLIQFKAPALSSEESEFFYTYDMNRMAGELRIEIGSTKFEISGEFADMQSAKASLSTSFEVLSNMTMKIDFDDFLYAYEHNTAVFSFKHFDKVFESVLNIHKISEGETNTTFTLVAPVFDWVGSHYSILH